MMNRKEFLFSMMVTPFMVDRPEILAERIYDVLSEYLLLLAEIHNWKNVTIASVSAGRKAEGNDYHIFLEMVTAHRVLTAHAINVGPDKNRAMAIRDLIAKANKLKVT